jgi:hypothetical protein
LHLLVPNHNKVGSDRLGNVRSILLPLCSVDEIDGATEFSRGSVYRFLIIRRRTPGLLPPIRLASLRGIIRLYGGKPSDIGLGAQSRHSRDATKLIAWDS